MVILRRLHQFPLLYHQSSQSLRHLPKSLRSIRSFHNTQSNRFIEPALGQIHNVLTGLHAFTGLPWVATLPLTAFLVRTIIVGPLQYRSHQAHQRQLDLQPLMNAWQHAFRRKVIREMGSLGPEECDRVAKRALKEKRKEMYKRWGCERWMNFLPIAQFPLWLLLIETIRKMCGTHQGLLGLVTSRFRGTSVETDREALEALNATSLSVEESFAEEGALWFQNLLAPDPLLVLPYVLSGALFTNIYLGSRSVYRQGREPSRFQRRAANALKILALAVAPMTLQVPSAMLVYWISSSALAIGQNLLLDWFMPYTPPVKPCKPKKSVMGAELMKN